MGVRCPPLVCELVAVILHLGCGQKPEPGRVNVDMVSMPGVDVVWNLDDHPWPWGAESVAEIHAPHVFEHVRDPLGFMAESWRVLERGGWLHIEVPHWQHQNAFTDPTHRRYCTEDTFRYWVPGTWLHDVGGVAYHRGCSFDEQRIQRVGPDLIVDLIRL